MRLSGFLFALFVGFALPALLIGAGMELPTPRLVALLIFGTAIGGLIPAGLDLLTHHMREEEASQIRQRDANSEMTRAHAAEVWAKVNPAPAPLVDEDSKSTQVDIFFRAGEAAGGFSIRRLKDVVGSTTWGRLTKFYSSEPGWNVLFDYGGDDGYRLAEKWTTEMVLTELAAEHFPLPPFQVRDVRPYVRPPTLQRATRQRKTPAQTAVIES